MGVMYYVGCRDCNETRELNKRRCLDINTLEQFMFDHMWHNCTIFSDDQDDGLYENDLNSKKYEWASKSIEVLSPLRYWGWQLLEDIKSLNLFLTAMGMPVFKHASLKEFETVLKSVEDHFVPKNED